MVQSAFGLGNLRIHNIYPLDGSDSIDLLDTEGRTCMDIVPLDTGNIPAVILHRSSVIKP